MQLSEWKRDLGFAAGVALRRPFQCFVQVTNRCNMRCTFCDFWPNGAPPNQELSLDDYRRLEQQLFSLGRFLISIEGGEPFLRPDLLEIVRIFGERHLPLLYTNGWYIDDAAARGLFAGGQVQVGVSIDYSDAARHDANRGWPGAWDKAWQAVDLLKAAAPHGDRQVHVMSVLMQDNLHDLEPLLELSAARGVGHCITLLSRNGFRRGQTCQEWPHEPISERLLALWRKYPHFRTFREYLSQMDAFLAGQQMPGCRAGIQSFNIDHLGNVSPCIEKIDVVAGNVRQMSLKEIHARLVQLDAGRNCQQCWTVCRGMNQALGGGGSLQSWVDLSTRLRSH